MLVEAVLSRIDSPLGERERWERIKVFDLGQDLTRPLGRVWIESGRLQFDEGLEWVGDLEGVPALAADKERFYLRDLASAINRRPHMLATKD